LFSDFRQQRNSGTFSNLRYNYTIKQASSTQWRQTIEINVSDKIMSWDEWLRLQNSQMRFCFRQNYKDLQTGGSNDKPLASGDTNETNNWTATNNQARKLPTSYLAFVGLFWGLKGRWQTKWDKQTWQHKKGSPQKEKQGRCIHIELTAVCTANQFMFFESISSAKTNIVPSSQSEDVQGLTQKIESLHGNINILSL
jgi:hypothetical protein